MNDNLINDNLSQWDRDYFFHPSTHLAQHARGESPNRIIKTLLDISKYFGNRVVSVCREMTKLYEKIYMGSIDRAIELFSNAKGEFVIIFKREIHKLSKSTINQYDKILSKGYKEGIKGKELITLLSELTGENKKFFYNRWLEIKNKNE